MNLALLLVVFTCHFFLSDFYEIVTDSFDINTKNGWNTKEFFCTAALHPWDFFW